MQNSMVQLACNIVQCSAMAVFTQVCKQACKHGYVKAYTESIFLCVEVIVTQQKADRRCTSLGNTRWQWRQACFTNGARVIQ